MSKRYLPLLVVAGLVLTGCEWLPTEPEAPPLQLTAPVSTQRAVEVIKRGDIQSRLQINVTFGTEEQRTLYTRSSGRVREIHARVGATVQAGQLLVELESGNLKWDLESAALDLEKARLDLERAESRFGFTDAPSEAEIDRLIFAIRNAELRYRRLAEQLEDYRIVAPFNGTVIAMSLQVGDQVDAYKDVVTVAAEGALVARATVDEMTAARLSPGQKVRIFPNDGNPAPVNGTVQTVPALGTAGRTPTIIIRPEESNRLRRGANARAEVIVEEKHDVVLVPLSAVRTFGGSSFVTVLQGESRQEVTIKLGLEDDKMAEVVEGLQEGDQVIAR